MIDPNFSTVIRQAVEAKIKAGKPVSAKLAAMAAQCWHLDLPIFSARNDHPEEKQDGVDYPKTFNV